MFKVGDKVKAKNPNLPFWMTVEVIKPYGMYECKFGYSNRSAGVFSEHELQLLQDCR